MFNILLVILNLQNLMCITLTMHFNVDAKFSSEILALYLDFVKFIAEVVNSYTQVSSNPFLNVFQ